MYYGLNNSQFLRLSEDVVPEQSIFVYRYLADHLLSFVRKELPVLVTKRILKDTLHGLAALHEQNIVHTGNHTTIL
jgi:serine/threonine protein kinase